MNSLKRVPGELSDEGSRRRLIGNCEECMKFDVKCGIESMIDYCPPRHSLRVPCSASQHSYMSSPRGSERLLLVADKSLNLCSILVEVLKIGVAKTSCDSCCRKV